MMANKANMARFFPRLTQNCLPSRYRSLSLSLSMQFVRAPPNDKRGEREK